MIRIRNFGNDRHCNDVPEVLREIQAYKGESVSVHDTRPGGKLLYVDVLESGEIRNSYGNNGIIDLAYELRIE